jgi:hypothetical protein
MFSFSSWEGGEKMQRYDNYAIQAIKTDEGFVRDAPIIGRTGILEYRNVDGSIRREYRPPEEAFNADSLASIRGKPITLGHHGLVSSANYRETKPVGTVISDGRQDGNNIRADVVIYSLDTDDRELSCGYQTELEETPGVTEDGQHYDAIQRNIVYNHLAIVPRGRAGNARLNMDGEQILESEVDKMSKKIKLDNGIEYDVPAEVEVAFGAMIAKADEQKKELDAMTAKFDSATAEIEKLKQDAVKAEADFKAKFDEAVKTTIELRTIAQKHGIEKADEMSNDEIKKAVVAKVHPKLSLDGKSAEYIEVAFDLAKDTEVQHEDAMAEQRKALNGEVHQDKELSLDEVKAKFAESESKLYKEVK